MPCQRKGWGSNRGLGHAVLPVAFSSSGVRHTHEALREHYRGGEHSWLDAEGENRWPNGARPLAPSHTQRHPSLPQAGGSLRVRANALRVELKSCVSQLATLVLWRCSAPPPLIVRDAMVAGADLICLISPRRPDGVTQGRPRSRSITTATARMWPARCPGASASASRLAPTGSRARPSTPLAVARRCTS